MKLMLLIFGFLLAFFQVMKSNAEYQFADTGGQDLMVRKQLPTEIRNTFLSFGKYFPPKFNMLLFTITNLRTRTTQTRTGGGYTNLRVVFDDDIVAGTAPYPDSDNKSITSSDFVFDSGKDFNYLYTDDNEFDLNENPADVIGSDAYAIEFKAFLPGENIYMRQFINEGYASKKMWVLFDSCEDTETYMVGKGTCCMASMKAVFKSGKKSSDQKGWEVIFKAEGVGVCTKYTGAGSMGKVYQLDPDDTTPDVSAGSGTYLIPANTGATAVSNLDNAVVNTLVTFKWLSDTNCSTFADGAVFMLASSFTPEKDATLTFRVIQAHKFAEVHRYIPA